MKSIILTFILITASVLMTSGQDKPKASSSAIPDSAHVETNPSGSFAVAERLRKEGELKALTLTDAETAEGLKIQKELEASNASLEEILAKTQAKVGDPDLLVRALASVYGNVLRNRSAATAWFVAAQKAHNCTGCLLEKGVFIKPTEEKK